MNKFFYLFGHIMIIDYKLIILFSSYYKIDIKKRGMNVKFKKDKREKWNW